MIFVIFNSLAHLDRVRDFQEVIGRIVDVQSEVVCLVEPQMKEFRILLCLGRIIRLQCRGSKGIISRWGRCCSSCRCFRRVVLVVLLKQASDDVHRNGLGRCDLGFGIGERCK